MVESWGQLSVLDLSGCDSELLISEKKIREFCLSLCKEIGMKPHGEAMIDKFGEGELYGLSGIQFIETSTITVHLDEKGRRVFIDIFSCKKFDAEVAEEFSKRFWRAERVKGKTIYRS